MLEHSSCLGASERSPPGNRHHRQGTGDFARSNDKLAEHGPSSTRDKTYSMKAIMNIQNSTPRILPVPELHVSTRSVKYLRRLRGSSPVLSLALASVPPTRPAAPAAPVPPPSPESGCVSICESAELVAERYSVTSSGSSSPIFKNIHVGTGA